MRRGLTVAAPAAGLSLLLTAVLAGCGGAGGVRTEESSASQEGQTKASPLPASPAPTPEPTDGEKSKGEDAEPAERLPTAASPVSPPGAKKKLDIIELLRKDPRVDDAVKRSLRPCTQAAWPVDVAYGKLTDGRTSDVVVNVSSCADGKGVGSYVYRAGRSGKYTSVFSYEVPSVYAEIDKRELRVYQEVYREDDPVCCPSGEDVVSFGWQDGGFVLLQRTYNEYPDYPESAEPSDENSGRTGGGD